MDPNEALRLIRAYIAQMKVEDQPGRYLAAYVQHARDLAETVEGLDEWLSKDGFLPFDRQAEEDKTSDTNLDQARDYLRSVGIDPDKIREAVMGMKVAVEYKIPVLCWVDIEEGTIEGISQIDSDIEPTGQLVNEDGEYFGSEDEIEVAMQIAESADWPVWEKVSF